MVLDDRVFYAEGLRNLVFETRDWVNTLPKSSRKSLSRFWLNKQRNFIERALPRHSQTRLNRANCAIENPQPHLRRPQRASQEQESTRNHFFRMMITDVIPKDDGNSA
jgi:hypothetical protein